MSSFRISDSQLVEVIIEEKFRSSVLQSATAVDSLGTGNITLTANSLLGGVIDNDPGGDVNWTLDTASNIVSKVLAYQGTIAVGNYFRCHLHNNATTSSGEVVTVITGSGVTLHTNRPTMTEGENQEGELVFVIRNITSGSEAVDAYFTTDTTGGGGITAPLYITGTGEQLRLRYDASNYTSFTNDSSGNMTVSSTGGVNTFPGDLRATDLYWYNGSSYIKYTPSLNPNQITIGEIGSGADYEFNSSTDISSTVNTFLSTPYTMIRFFKGTFRLSSPLVIQASAISIIGEGYISTTLNTDAGVSAISYAGAGGARIYKARLSNLNIIHNGDSSTGNAGTVGLSIEGMSLAIYDNLVISNFATSLSILSISYYNHFQNVTGLSFNGSYTVYFNLDVDGQPNANRFVECRFQNATSGGGDIVRFDGGNDNTFESCCLELWTNYALYFNDGIQSCRVINCRLENTATLGVGAVYFHTNSDFNIVQDCYNVGQTTVTWNSSTTNTYINNTYSSQVIRRDQDYNNSNWINYRRNGAAAGSETLMHLEDLYSASGTPITLKLSSARPGSKMVTGNYSGSERFYATTDGNGYFYNGLSVGTTATSATVNVVDTTEQLRLGYDASNYMSTTVNSSGVPTITTTADYLTIAKGLNLTGDKIYNVKSFGAKGDGVTDDAVALQAFVDFLEANSGVGFIPTGTYLTSVQIAMASGSDICIIGSNENDTIIRLTASNTYVMLVSACSNCIIKNLTLDANSNNTSGNITIYNNSTNVVMENVNLINWAGYGLYLNSVTNITVNNCNITGISIAGSSRGLYFITSTSNIRMNNCTIQQCASGIVFSGASYCILSNFYINDTNKAIDLFTTNNIGNIMNNFQITGFVQRGISLSNSIDSLYTNMSIFSTALSSTNFPYVECSGGNAKGNRVECMIKYVSGGQTREMVRFASSATKNVVVVKTLSDITDATAVIGIFNATSSNNTVIVEKLDNVTSLTNYYTDSASGAFTFIITDDSYTRNIYNQRINIQRTTEQLRLAYDVSNYSALTVDSSGTLNISSDVTVPTKTPANASDTGVTGTVTWDSNYIYICTATNTWKRVAIATW